MASVAAADDPAADAAAADDDCADTADAEHVGAAASTGGDAERLDRPAAQFGPACGGHDVTAERHVDDLDDVDVDDIAGERTAAGDDDVAGQRTAAADAQHHDDDDLDHDDHDDTAAIGLGAVAAERSTAGRSDRSARQLVSAARHDPPDGSDGGRRATADRRLGA